MTVTFVPGQRIEQPDAQRTWELIAPLNAADGGVQRWMIRLITAPPIDPRRVGSECTASVTWLSDHCRDFVPVTVDPPCGDGTQRVWIVDGNDVCLDGRSFDSAAVMLEWVETAIGRLIDEGNDARDLTVRWYGWQPDDADEAADMVATVSEGWAIGDDETALVWAEA